MSKRARNRNCIGVSQDPLEHSCILCGFKTISVTGMRLHLKMSHKVEKPWIEKKISFEKCNVCEKVFKEMKMVIEHVKKNTSTKMKFFYLISYLIEDKK